MGDCSRPARSHTSGDSTRSFAWQDRRSRAKGKARADDLAFEPDDLDARTSSPSHKGKGRQTNSTASHSSPVLTLPDMGDDFEVHLKNRFSHMKSDGPSTLFSSHTRDRYGHHPRSAHRTELLLSKSAHKRSYNQSTSSPLSSPLSYTFEADESKIEIPSPQPDDSRLRSVAMSREQVRTPSVIISKKRRANTTSTDNLDDGRASRLFASDTQSHCPTVSISQSRRTADEAHDTRFGSCRSSLRSNSSTSDIGLDFELPCDLRPTSSRSSQSSDELINALFDHRGRHPIYEATQDSDCVAPRLQMNERLTNAENLVSTEAPEDGTLPNMVTRPHRRTRDLASNVRPLLLPSLTDSERRMSDDNSAAQPRLNNLRLDTLDSDGQLFSSTSLEHWFGSDQHDTSDTPRDTLARSSQARPPSLSHFEPNVQSPVSDPVSPYIAASRYLTSRSEDVTDRQTSDIEPAMSGVAVPRHVDTSASRPLYAGTARSRVLPLLLTGDVDRSNQSRDSRRASTLLSTLTASEELQERQERFASRILDTNPLARHHSTETRSDPLRSQTGSIHLARSHPAALPLAARDSGVPGREADDTSIDRSRRALFSDSLLARREQSRALLRPSTTTSTTPRRSQDETALNYLRRLMSEDSSLEDDNDAAAQQGETRATRYPSFWDLHRPSTSDWPSERIALDPRNFVADDDWSGFDTFEGLMRLADEIGHAETRVPPPLLETLPTCEYGKWDGGSCDLSDCPTPPDKGKGKQKCHVPHRDLMCPICREDYRDPDMLMSVPRCHHAFHADCLTTWFQNAKTCPLCRADVLSTHAPALF